MYSALYMESRNPFLELTDKVVKVDGPSEFADDERGFLVLWGGADISPTIYGAKRNPHTYAHEAMSLRDRLEVNLAREAMSRGMLIVGVCRGAQLMCALSGGKLVQHVSGHSSSHDMETEDGLIMDTSSLHHQMMYPWNVDHELIAWSSPPLSSYHQGETVDEDLVAPVERGGLPVEPEIVFFPETNALAIQGHPEYRNPDTPFVKYCNQLIKEYCQ